MKIDILIFYQNTAIELMEQFGFLTLKVLLFNDAKTPFFLNYYSDL